MLLRTLFRIVALTVLIGYLAILPMILLRCLMQRIKGNPKRLCPLTVRRNTTHRPQVLSLGQSA